MKTVQKRLVIGRLNVLFTRDRQYDYRALWVAVLPLCLMWGSMGWGIHILRGHTWQPLLAHPFKQYPA